MRAKLRIVAAQLNFWVGDVEGNAQRIVEAATDARDRLCADVVAFPEMSLLGYPPDDLLLRSGLPAAVAAGLNRIGTQVEGIHVIVGHPEYTDDAIYNAATVFRDRRVVTRARKQLLPNYGVFDEKRHFRAGREPCVFEVHGVPVGLCICEDLWGPDPGAWLKRAGAEVLVSLNASPFRLGKDSRRIEVLTDRVQESRLPILYVNLVGGQDDLLFDGGSIAMNPDGAIAFRAPHFEEGLHPLDFDGRMLSGDVAASPEDDALVYRGLVQGIRDYVDRNGFPGAVVGASGGIDSALVLALAADALGPARVRAVAMPSRYTADMSNEDAAAEARALGTRFDTVTIEPPFRALLDVLAPLFDGKPVDLAEENLQSRIRGTILMALSNKHGELVLATGNKSEMGVGYATLYGDMAGGFAPIKDVYKTRVYRLARWRNTQSPVIPERVIERPPSAELRADQVDQDSLPPYETLDAILEAYVEDQQSIPDIVAAGYDEVMVRRVAALVRRSEYKRRQAPPGPKITRRAFGRDRRYPITAVYGDV